MGGEKGLFGAGTSTFRQPQNRRVLRPPGREAQEIALAESACSGVGGAAKWKGKAKRSLEMEEHHRGRQRYIKPPSRRSDVQLLRSILLPHLSVPLSYGANNGGIVLQILPKLLKCLEKNRNDWIVISICAHKSKGHTGIFCDNRDICHRRRTLSSDTFTGDVYSAR